MTDIVSGRVRVNWWNIGLWTAQIVLALFYGFAGFMKLATPYDQLATMMAWVTVVPAWLVTFIAVVELLGALGLILPSVTRILPWLTPLAALGVAIIQVLAIGVHGSLGETATTLPINLVALFLALFVAWGRFRKAPIAAR